MYLAPWRSPLALALHRNRSLVYARYLQLATVNANGAPANRTLVFRGFLEGSNHLMFVTDARSEKTLQIAHNPQGEVCWYFPKTREQFRIAGLLHLVDHDRENLAWQSSRRATWQALSDPARAQFTWSHPGQPRTTESTFSRSAPDPSEPLPNFCLLLLEPLSVDHLELRGDPHNRCRYFCQNNQDNDRHWLIQAMNP
ncbi:MAG: pyridoxamine 5'-phosphate oxidase family protein [Scytolyngbya sp. HA4215-MV1]|jgi:PPOX class probable FMN-dependent enzyme|nr:pyridoxamine 5'-phosphate oxidase family protein [Scytolyngbya sp. HA4215-MV1]